jgi:putative ABC transport system substrate-binding protein
MHRRQFITLLGGAAAWPLAARAQKGERMRRIGVLMNTAADDREGQAGLAAFHKVLQQIGWAVGQNVQIDTRWGENKAELDRKYATELVALAPDVILASGSPSVAALQYVTRAVPIVFVRVSDPVGGGFVDSLARPRGNATGFMLFEYSFSGKWLELLKQIVPQMVSGSSSGFQQPCWDRRIRCHPVCGIVTRRRGTPGRCTRWRRDRTRPSGPRSLSEWRRNRDPQCGGVNLS